MRLPQEMSLAQIAQMLGGTVHGDGQIKVSTVSPSPVHAGEDDLAFVFDKQLVKKLPQCKAKAVLAPTGTEKDYPERTFILVDRPNLAIQRILTALKPKRYTPPAGIHSTAIIDPSTEIGEGVAIGPYVVIGPKCKIGARTIIMSHTVIGGEVTVGEDCHFYPACLIADYVKIGNRVILQQGAALGADGFGYVTERESNLEKNQSGRKDFSQESNPLLKIPQIGNVVLEDDVEVGSYATIDRATMGSTIIGSGSKIDNLVMIAHNNRIGKDVMIIANAAVGGSCSVGDRSVLGGSANLSDHITMAPDAVLAGASGAMRDIGTGEIHAGTPALPGREFFGQIAAVRRMPKVLDDLKDLKKRIALLEQQILEKQVAAK
ncbi:MAG: UDP-3-O-(3-hydroxymyristoyl)glucosamine N-acyltransferase [Candidatus Melainabacteria bacterium]|nr:UDP-3-O-(3-hydroxymyristoyl)glucosamine N-acyltransferase [Candidatus Melainabacteria bacterium]